MSENKVDHLEKVYIEASHWVRMCNSIIWSMGTFLVPISAACIGLALQYPERKIFLASASIFLFSLWVYVSRLYRGTASNARQVLIEIEEEWGIKEEAALYKMHGQIGLKIYGLFSVQFLCLLILIVLWIVLIIFLPNTSNKQLTPNSPTSNSKLG